MTTSSTSEIIAKVAEITLTKGTGFAGFDYNGRRRNVTVGAQLGKAHDASTQTKKKWGKSFAKSTLIAYSGKMYLQCIENVSLGKGQVTHQVKRFALDKVSNFSIG